MVTNDRLSLSDYSRFFFSKICCGMLLEETPQFRAKIANARKVGRSRTKVSKAAYS